MYIPHSVEITRGLARDMVQLLDTLVQRKSYKTKGEVPIIPPPSANLPKRLQRDKGVVVVTSLYLLLQKNALYMHLLTIWL